MNTNHPSEITARAQYIILLYGIATKSKVSEIEAETITEVVAQVVQIYGNGLSQRQMLQASAKRAERLHDVACGLAEGFPLAHPQVRQVSGRVLGICSFISNAVEAQEALDNSL